MPASTRRPLLWLAVAATMITGIAWGVVIPPFEGLDESHYYQAALASANGTKVSRPPLFFAATTPLLRLIGDRDVPFRIRANPLYRPGFNRHGEVSFFLHDRTHGVPASHVRRLYVLRGVALLVWLLTIVAAYEVARLVFADGELALLVAGFCLFLPQVSFFLAKVHTDTMATLVSTLAYLVLVSRAVGKIGRLESLLASAALLALTPWADRQAYPLFLTVPIALILLERSWPQRMFAAALALIAFAALVWWVSTSGSGGDLSAWIGPLLPSYRGRWWSADTGNYLLFEALPKTIFGFIGWFNSSLLLPPWMYAAILVTAILAVCGLVLAGVSRPAPIAHSGMRTGRELALLILAIAVVNTVLPNVYTNVLIVRNPDGRYLFPALVPMVLLCVIGLRALARRARAWPWLPPTGLAAGIALYAVLSAPRVREWIAAGVTANHYGNQAHLLATIRDVVFGLLLAPLLFMLVRAVAPWWSSTAARTAPFARLLAPRGLFVIAWILNLTLLVTFVRPLYRPLDAAQFADAIHDLVEAKDFARAAAVSRIAIEEFPDSPQLQRIAATGGVPPDLRPDLKALARAVRTGAWPDPERLSSLVDGEGPSEGAALLRMQLHPELKTDPAAAARLLQQTGAVPIDADLNRQASVIGVSVQADPSGGCQVTVFFRPKVEWTSNHLWLHAYPPDSHDYDDLPATPPAFAGWSAGELAWETFHSTRESFSLFGGVAIGSLGPATLLGKVSNCAPP